jgi:hypothetical protein
MWLPYLPVSVAVVAFAVRFWPPERGDALIFAAGMVLSVAVLLRHLLVLDRNDACSMQWPTPRCGTR